MKKLNVIIEDARYSGMRIDKYVAEVLRLFNRSRLKYCDLTVTANGKKVKLSRQIQPGDVLELMYTEPPPPAYSAEEVPLDILYENDDVIVVNKPQGLVVHPGSGVASGTLVQGLLFRCRSMAEDFEGETVRPGIVHRLDRDTSGVLIAAKNPDALEFLSSQFQARSTQKVYYALVKGRPSKRRGVISTCIARDPVHRKRFTVSETRGKPAVTRYQVLRVYRGYSFIRLMPETGRTHQLRVHMKAAGCPVLGDPVYARKDPAFPESSLMLHAFSLAIRLPGNGEMRVFHAPLPPRFREILERFNREFRVEK